MYFRVEGEKSHKGGIFAAQSTGDRDREERREFGGDAGRGSCRRKGYGCTGEN